MSHKLTDEEKEKQRRTDLERLRQQTLENNKSFDPRLIRRPTVQLYSPTVSPDIVTPAAKKTEESSAAVQSTVQADQAVEFALVPESLVEKPAEPVSSEDRIKPPSRITESMAEKMSKLKKAADATKNNVRVTEQVFSCVTDYAIIRGVDKVNVVTYLLYAHLPKKDQLFKTPPEYLIKEPPDGPRNRDLTFFEDPGLTERLGWVSSTYGLPRVDIIENIILDNLPIVEKNYPPKRRRKRRRRPAY
jgi:hypothetical protein